MQRYIRELELYGFLKRSKRGKRNQYELLPLYEPPLGHGSIEETGQLEVENVSKRRPPAPRTLHRRRLDPQPLPLAAPVRSIEPRRSLQQDAPVRPVPGLAGHDSAPLAAPVRPIAASQPHRRSAGLRIVAEQQSAPMRPDKAAPVQLGEQNAPHPCGTINNLATNNQHQQDAGVSDLESHDETATIDDALAQLQRVKVNLDVSDLGVHFGRGRRLAPKELAAWAQWVNETSHAGILNKCAFAASKIRMGCTLEDVFPDFSNARRAALRAEEDQRRKESLARSERERQEDADRLIAKLSPSDRERLREQAIKHSKSWLSERVSSERFALALASIERRLVLEQSSEGA